MALEQIGLEAVLNDANFQAGLKRYIAGLSQATGQTEKTASGMTAFGHTISTAVGSALGVLTAQVIPAAIGGLRDLAGQALDAYAKHERLGMALESLVAKELVATSGTTTLTQVGAVHAQLTEKQRNELDKLNETLPKMSAQLAVNKERLAEAIAKGKESAAEIELRRQNIVKLERDIASGNTRVSELTASESKLIPVMKAVTSGQMSMADALKAAGPQAQELLRWIQQLAIESPFTQEGVATAFRTAMAYGFTAKEAQRLTTAMIDFAAGSGASESAMGTIALALGQIKAKGKLAGQEVLQLVNAGLSVDAILAKAFGKSTAEIVAMRENGLIPADKAIEAITKSLEQDFGGAAKRQAGTFSGLLSSLSDIKEVGLREFFTGTFQAIQPYLDKFTSVFSDPKTMASINAIGTVIGDKIGGALESIFEIINTMGAKGGTAGIFLEYLGLDSLAKFWNEQGPSIIKSVQDLGKTIADAFGPVIADAIPFIQGLLSELSQWFADNGPLISKYITVVSERMGNFATAVAGAWKVIKPILKTLFDTILGLAKLIMQVAVGDWKGAWKTIQTTAASAWDGIKKAASEFGNWVASWMGTTLDDIGKQWSKNWEMFKVIVGKVTDDIAKTVRGWLNSVGKFISDTWNSILDTIRQVWRDIGRAIENAIKSISDVVNNGLELIRKTLIAAWDFITSDTQTKWGVILSAITTVVSNVISAVRSGFDLVKATVEGAWAAIRDGIWGWWQQITQTLWSAIAAIPGLVKDAIAKLIEIGINIVTTIADAIREAWYAAGGIITTIYNSLATLWEDLASGELLAQIARVATGIIGTIAGALSSLWNEAGGVIYTLRNLLIGMWQSFQDLDLGAVGHAIINAIIGGIQANWQNFVNWLLDAIRGIFGTGGATGMSANVAARTASAGFASQPVTQLSRVSNVSNVFNLYVTSAAPVSTVVQDFGTMQALAGV